ncbi:MAG: hypothetical protein ABIP51_22695 [Bacteroidia bacterium]
MSEVASVGKPQVVTMNVSELVDAANAGMQGDENTSGEVVIDADKDVDPNLAKDNANDKPTFNADSLKEYFKSQGIEFDGTIDDIKEKLKPQGLAPTPEEIAKKEADFERRMLQVHLDGGGKVEDFAAVKKMLTADVSEVSKAQLHQELLAKGFDENEAKAMAKQMFLQDDLENLEQDIDNDETDEAFEKRKARLESKVKYGADNLANRSLHIQTTAKNIWENLKQEVEQQDADVAKETKFSATVDEHVKALPKSVSISIGQIDGKDIEPVVYNKPEEITAIHNEIADLLKDTSKRNGFFFTPDGQLNIANITDLYVKAKIGEKTATDVFMKGQTRQVKIFEERFPNRTGQGLGVGGSNAKPPVGKGQPVSAGQPQRIKPIHN